MKRIFCALLILPLAALCACSGINSPEQGASLPTEAVTEAPTAEPTEAPIVTQAPDFSGLIPQTGKLVEGPIFPDPAKYLVISGEGDIFYVYDNMGDLVRTFKGVEDEYSWGSPGFYGEDGICENVRISTGEVLPKFGVLGDIFIFFDCDWENGRFPLHGIADEDLNMLFSFTDEEAPDLGDEGGVLHIGDDYLVLCRGFDFAEGGNWIKCFLYDGTGTLIRSVDPAPFGRILGVFGGKYLICGAVKQEGEEDYFDWFDTSDCSLFTLDGEVVMEHVSPVSSSSFAVDDEIVRGMLITADYLEDAEGRAYDGDLNLIAELPEDRSAMRSPMYSRYGSLFSEMDDLGYYAEVWRNDLYCGVRLLNEDGSRGGWTFRIYNPKLVSDHDNDHRWWDD